MDALARYVAGPVAVASLGIALFQASPFAAIPFWMLAAVWGVAGLRAWQRDHLTLEERTIRLANRIARCQPGARNFPPMRRGSIYGPRISAARLAVEAKRHKPRRWQRDHLKYTDKVQERPEGIIEKWGLRGVMNSDFQHFATGARPDPGDYEKVASRLASIASPRWRPPL